MMEIQSLPSELLGKIFSHVRNRNANSRKDNNGQESIKQCRLVSRHFSDVASPFLIDEVTVLLSLESFTRLENICRHPTFSKSVRKVNLGLSFYEAELASDKHLYMQEAHARLLRHVETYERMRQYRQRHPMTSDRYNWLADLAWGPINRLESGEADDKPPTPIQKLFSKGYDLYKEKYDNQESLRRNNSHISRLCAALCSLSNLVLLDFVDWNDWSDELIAADFLDTGFDRDVLRDFDSIIRRSKWSGYFYTKDTATPPVEMLGLLGSQLGEKGLRPKGIRYFLLAPPRMQIWEIQSNQQAGLKCLVSHCTALKIEVGLSRRPYDRRNVPRHEMLALCSITKTMLSAPNLEFLTISFNGCFDHSRPTFSLSDILPPGISWPRLQSLELLHLPATVEELKSLVSQHLETVSDFTWDYGDLFEGTWSDAIEAIRGFRALKKGSLRLPSVNGDMVREWPEKEVRSYLLRETDQNPFHKKAKNK